MMKHSHCLTLTTLAAALLALNHPASADDGTTLSPVVVTATRTPVTADDTLASVTVISQQQIQTSGARDVGDLLRDYAGVDAVRAGNVGQQTSIFMRGANSSQTLVMVDGIPINDGTDGGVNIQNLRPEDIDHIEVVRGPRSSLYGSDAIGGVINIITRAPDSTSTDITLTGGQENTFGGQVKQSFKANAFSGAVSYGGLDSKGYPLLTAGGPTYPDLNPDLSIDRGSRNQDTGAELDYNQGDVSVRGRFLQNNGNTQYLDGGGNPLDQRFLNNLGSLVASMQVDPNYLTTLRLSSFRDNLDQSQSSDYAHTHRNEIDWQNDYTLPHDNLVTIGADYRAEYVGASVYGTEYNTNLSTRAAYIQDQWKYQQLSAQLAGRYESNATFGQHKTGEGAIGWAFDKNNSVYASLSSGFHAPSGDQLYLPASLGGNPNLGPETSRNREIGSHHQLGDWHVQTAVYTNEVENLIAGEGPNGQLININRAHLRGAELGLGYQHGGFSWQNQFGLVEAIDAEDSSRLLRRPLHSFSSTIDYGWDRYNVGGGVVAAGNSADNSYPAPSFGATPITLGGYAVLDLHAGVKLSNWASFSVNVDNLANKQYSLASADIYNTADTESSQHFYRAQPRLASATLRLKF